jgi:hypothetical protein
MINLTIGVDFLYDSVVNENQTPFYPILCALVAFLPLLFETFFGVCMNANLFDRHTPNNSVR